MMTTYYILDRQSNTWSDQHYPLSSILATPGITGEHILANARTQQTLTVAQARAQGTAALKPTTAAPLSRQIAGYKPTPGNGNKTISGGLSQNRTRPKNVGSHQLPLSSLQSKGTAEYKVISQSDAIFNGQFNAQQLSRVLNSQAKKGWRVLSCNNVPVDQADGSTRQELLIVLTKAEA